MCSFSSFSAQVSITQTHRFFLQRNHGKNEMNMWCGVSFFFDPSCVPVFLRNRTWFLQTARGARYETVPRNMIFSSNLSFTQGSNGVPKISPGTFELLCPWWSINELTHLSRTFTMIPISCRYPPRKTNMTMENQHF